jgi:hypothetical protein
VRHRPPGGKSVSADLRSLTSMTEAEAETQIKHQQVALARRYGGGGQRAIMRAGCLCRT